jgi:hypothetical protein
LPVHILHSLPCPKLGRRGGGGGGGISSPETKVACGHFCFGRVGRGTGLEVIWDGNCVGLGGGGGGRGSRDDSCIEFFILKCDF